MPARTGLALYDETAARVSHAVLSEYSTSFGLGTRLLDRRARRGIEAVYALVRIADEIVDTCRGADAGAMLAELEEQTARALDSGYSTNLAVHAFARTARRAGIGHGEVDPFFASMRMDLTVVVHDRDSYQRYVYGSAEVVGLMCLAVFLDEGARPGRPARPDPRLRAGARALGAAFQKINFLRDLGADYGDLGRSYFPDLTPGTLDQNALDAILTEVAADVATARSALPGLPRRARWAVACTLGLFERLTIELAATPPADLLSRRVRLSGPTKIAVVGRTLARAVATEARSTCATR
jgi:phytoene synthase